VGDFSIRLATAADAEACSDVYRPYVQATALTFETAVPTVSEFAARITSATATHAWLVLERGGVVVGYASSRTFDERDAYRWSCETGLYLTSASHGNGGGHLLYAALLDQLAARGYRIAVGRIVVPNAASIRLHERLGFQTVGTLRSIGWKLDAWHDVVLMEKVLGDLNSSPGDIRSPSVRPATSP
jgi:L-amino acid N-acyltransferase YncA